MAGVSWAFVMIGILFLSFVVLFFSGPFVTDLPKVTNALILNVFLDPMLSKEIHTIYSL